MIKLLIREGAQICAISLIRYIVYASKLKLIHNSVNLLRLYHQQDCINTYRERE